MDKANQNVFENLGRWARDNGHDAAKLEELLTCVADAESIALRLYDADRVTSSEEERRVLGIEGIAVWDFKSTQHRSMPIGVGSNGLFAPNDGGKTTLQLAARYAIGGARAVGVGLDDRIIRAGKEEAKVEISLPGRRLIRRTIKRRVVKKGPDAGQTKIERGLYVKLSDQDEDKPAKAQAEIDTWVGGSSAFALSIAFLEQGMIVQLVDQDPAQRKEAIFKLIGVSQAEDTAKRLRGVVKKWEEENGRAQVKLEHLTAQLTMLRRDLAACPPAAALDAEIESLKPVVGAANRDVAAARGKIETRLQQIAALDVMKLSVPDVAYDVESARAALMKALDEQHAADAELEALRARYRDIAALPAKCPTCAAVGRECDLSDEWKAAQLAEINRIGGQKKVAAEALVITCGDAKKTAEALAEMERQRRDTIAARRPVEEERARLVAERDALPAGAMPDASAIARYEWAIEKLRLIGALQRTIEAADLESLTITSDVPRFEWEGNAVRGAGELELLRTLVLAFSKDGMPQWIARQHLARVNAIAREMAAPDRFVYAFGPDLDVQVIDPQQDQAVIHPSLASGSARERGALVLAAAMSRYQQELARLKSDLLWIDELPFQDAANAQVVVDLVRGFTKFFERVVFAASDWEHYTGKFDHEVSFGIEAVSAALDDKRQRDEKLKAEGQGVLAPPPPEVKLYADDQGDYGPRFAGIIPPGDDLPFEPLPRHDAALEIVTIPEDIVRRIVGEAPLTRVEADDGVAAGLADLAGRMGVPKEPGF